MIATLHAAPLAAGRNTLVVGVADPRGTPIRGATVVVTASSLEMGMGTVASVADERQAGHYTADVSLDMAGRWQVAVQVTRPGGTTATFSYLVALTGDEGTPPADSPSPASSRDVSKSLASERRAPGAQSSAKARAAVGLALGLPFSAMSVLGAQTPNSRRRMPDPTRGAHGGGCRRRSIAPIRSRRSR